MAISSQDREFVRQRANCACEYCGVTETDTGSELTIDHYQPRSQGGSDDISNLIYCCVRCNLNKRDYWPASEDDLLLWNPRRSAFRDHFLELDNGSLLALTPTGELTLNELRLNRRALIDFRARRQQTNGLARLLAYDREQMTNIERLEMQFAQLLEEQRELLRIQTEYFKRLLDDLDSK